jgi:Uma2 family endonuclease
MTAILSNPPVGKPRSQTVEDYLALPDTRGFELDDGSLVEKNVGVRSGWVGGYIFLLISVYVRERSLGWVFPSEVGYQCYPGHPDRMRKPDVSFVRRGRLPLEKVTEPFILIAPDLVVEVVSPNDTVYDLDRKIEEYLEAGVRLVWVVNPEIRKVRIYRVDGTSGIVDERGTASGEDVLSGFQFAVADLFRETVTPI